MAEISGKFFGIMNRALRTVIGGNWILPMDEIAEAVKRDGRWQRHDEWRISTVTTTIIERTNDDKRYRRYRVWVECDYTFEAYCPTLERACRIAEIYRNLIPELFHTHGWPSWASKTVLEPAD